MMDDGSFIGGRFFKIVYYLHTAAGWQPNLAAMSAVDTPSSSQQSILVFSSTVVSFLLPIAKLFAQNFKNLGLKN
jgi:hypothetical protein